MAKIGNDRMIVRGERRTDNSWLFTICYTAHFAESDLGQRFDDAVDIRCVHSEDGQAPRYAPPVAFKATGTRVFRKKRVVVRGEDYDARAGLDAVCAWIRLHHGEPVQSQGIVDDEQHTPPLIPSGGVHHRAARRATAQSLRC